MFLKHCRAQELFSKHWKYVNKVLRWQYRLPDSSQAFWGPSGEKSGSWFCHLRRANHFFSKYQTYVPFQHVQSISLCPVHIQLHFIHSRILKNMMMIMMMSLLKLEIPIKDMIYVNTLTDTLYTEICFQQVLWKINEPGKGQCSGILPVKRWHNSLYEPGQFT